MRWRGGRRSENVEDRRGAPVGFGRGGMRLGGGTLVLVLLGAWLLGVNPLEVLTLLAGGGGQTLERSDPPPVGAPTDEGADFVSVVLADTEDTWNALFGERRARYE